MNKPLFVHIVRSVFVAVAATGWGLASTACGPTANNAQTTQIMQEARGDLKREPGDKAITTLNMTRAAELAAKGGTGEPADREGGEGDMLTPPSRENAERELDARAMAQDGAVLLLAGEEAKGATKLRESMDLAPTTDALVYLAPWLAREGELEELAERCSSCLEVCGDDERFTVLDMCRRARPGVDVDEALEWASPADRRWYEEVVASQE